MRLPSDSEIREIREMFHAAFQQWKGRENTPELCKEIERKVISLMQKARTKGIIPLEFRAFRFDIRPPEDNPKGLSFFPEDEYTQDALHQVWYTLENVDDPHKFKNKS